MRIKSIGKIAGLIAAVALGVINTSNAAVLMVSDGIGYINPALVGSNFKATDLDRMIGQYNGTVADVVGDKYYTVHGTSVPAAPLPYPLNTQWYDNAPGGDSVNFTTSTLGANTLGLPVNTATATLNIGTGGYLYLVAQWDGGSATGNNSIYYIGGMTGSITLVNDLVKYIGGNASQQALSHFYLVPVPEPTTMVAGALLLLPFAASTIRFVRKNRAA